MLLQVYDYGVNYFRHRTLEANKRNFEYLDKAQAQHQTPKCTKLKKARACSISIVIWAEKIYIFAWPTQLKNSDFQTAEVKNIFCESRIFLLQG